MSVDVWRQFPNLNARLVQVYRIATLVSLQLARYVREILNVARPISTIAVHSMCIVEWSAPLPTIIGTQLVEHLLVLLMAK